MKTQVTQIHRRTLLRGAGVAMALPWLESIPVWGREAAAGSAHPAFPKRFAALFMGNGISPNHWWAKGAGRDMELSKTLEPMEPFKSRLNVITGLFNKNATGVGIHPGTDGQHPLRGRASEGGRPQGGDQHGPGPRQPPRRRDGPAQPRPGLRTADHRLSRDQLLDGLQLAHFLAERVLAGPHGGLPFPGLRQPVRQPGEQAHAQSILDRVKEHASQLDRQVSRADQAKLDEYLTSVREVEKRIGRTRVEKDKADDRAQDRGRPALTMPRPDNGLPEDIREHMRLMCDIIALAFQTDKTRVATLLLCRDLSGLFYPFLDVRTAHHPASHDDQSEAYQRVSHYYVSQLAYLAGRLAAMPEGEHSVLDHSCLLFLSNMWSGSKHDSTKLPILLVGGMGGTLETGRVLDYTGRADGDRKLCSLYLSLMDRMDVKADRFGDAGTRLAGL